MDIVAYKGHVTGRVQGVGFRYFTQEQAVFLDVVGYVKNLPDTSVDFFIQGSQSQCEVLLTKIKKGPPFSKVESCEYSQVEIDSTVSIFDVIF